MALPSSHPIFSSNMTKNAGAPGERRLFQMWISRTPVIRQEKKTVMIARLTCQDNTTSVPPWSTSWFMLEPQDINESIVARSGDLAEIIIA